MKVQTRYHKLDLSYQDFIAMQKQISSTDIGKYIIFQKIGEGSFGQVYKGMNDQTKLPVAVKVIDLRCIKQDKNDRIREIRLRLAQSQDKIMSLCRSDYIVNCFDVYQNDDLKIMMMEYCNGGTLAQYIAERRKIPEKEAIIILKQLLNGIAKLHSLNIIHRDLKADNILNHNNLYKLADFGMSKELPNIYSKTETVVGTPNTMAPEVLSHQKYNTKADIWSIGVIFFNMLFGCMPFKKESKSMILHDIHKSQILTKRSLIVDNTEISKEAYDLLKLILVVDPEKRIGWRQLIKHPIFKENQNGSRIHPELTYNPSLPSQCNPEDSINSVWPDLTSSLKEIVKVIKVQSQKAIKKKQQIKQSNSDIEFELVSRTLNECLKAQLIFQEIIQKIQHHQLLNLQKREVVEFMYLISTRCFLDLSPIHSEMTILSKKDSFFKETYDAVQQLYLRLKKRWEHYHKLLTDVENQLLSRLSDFLQPKANIQVKDKFMNGIQNVDYTKEEQLSFIDRVYIRQLLNKIEAVAAGHTVKDLLVWYKEINLIKSEDYYTQGFEAYINKLIQH